MMNSGSLPSGLSSIRRIRKMSQAVLSGPSPSFGAAHIMLALMTIGESSYVGRESLARDSGLGMGAVRTVLKKLRSAGYVEAIRSGCYLTPGGKRWLSSLDGVMSTFVPMSDSGLTVGASEIAVALRGLGSKVRSGIDQRDAAIRIGASGVTTYVVRAGKFTIPGGSNNCEKDFPGPAWSKLRAALKPRSGDAIVLCGAPTETSAKLGALAAMMTLA